MSETTSSDTANAVPSSIRRLDSPSAARLIRMVEAFDDLQTVLSCCERLIPKLARTVGELDEVAVEALWTLALLSYARSFAGEGDAVVLTADDLTGPQPAEELLRWHQVMLHLRDHHADSGQNPREVYSVGLAQDDSGGVGAIAVSSVRAAVVDEAAVRQAGAMVYPLCALLDERINALQKTILDEVRDTPKTELDAMDLIEVVAAN